MVHEDINPTQVVPAGPDLRNWLSDHGREKLGGTPFGRGTARARCRPRNGRRGPTPLRALNLRR
ncbi:hypothetical protein GCM10029992_55170 [Glycomyces albus]